MPLFAPVTAAMRVKGWGGMVVVVVGGVVVEWEGGCGAMGEG